MVRRGAFNLRYCLRGAVSTYGSARFFGVPTGTRICLSSGWKVRC